MRLFHFSDDPNIKRFVPRPVLVPTERPAGQEWLNGPLVWAVSEFYQANYLFPRDCPRILLWLDDDTTPEDRKLWWGTRDCRTIAHIEWDWFERVRDGVLYRYEFSVDLFERLSNSMWIARTEAEVIARETIDSLPEALREHGAELRIMHSLTALLDVWSNTSLAVSGIRLHHAKDWPADRWVKVLGNSTLGKNR